MADVAARDGGWAAVAILPKMLTSKTGDLKFKVIVRHTNGGYVTKVVECYRFNINDGAQRHINFSHFKL